MTDTVDIEQTLAKLVRQSEARTAEAMETFVTDRLTTKFDTLSVDFTKTIKALTDKLEQDIDKGNEVLKKSAPLRDKKVAGVTVKGLKHRSVGDLMNLLAARMHPMLVGPAGSGKSMSAQQCATAMKLNFYVQSVGAQTSMSQIFGYRDANSNYVPTHFRTAYEHGGIFCMDEIDAGNANVLVGINSALSNDLCSFPDAIVPIHKDFYMIATANTIGRGATPQYSGRNRLDEATLDRFVPLWWDYDKDLETILAGASEEEQDWLRYVWKVRDYIEKQGIQVVVSTRAVIKGAKLIPYFSKDKIIELVFLNTVPKDHHQALKAL